ncbi:3-keto-disaccharide hydrolase [Bryobacter aggregatus]|uniref:3-keto-disaccharide hydrolase n=1 Tax=Bryobacter aggregatus TaxID=360054 RepID=UPI0004E0E4C4|nr:DUF1080 domain-containing protein [Bryobacter aggregatus]
MRFVYLFSALVCASALFAADPSDKPFKPEKGFTSLFNGKDLTGWTKSKENEDSFSVKDGAIVASGKRCHLYFTGLFKGKPASFKNFELRLSVMTKPVSNGGIYFHTKYQPTGFPETGFEVQVNNTHGDWKKSGGLYNVQDVKESVPDNVWYTQTIIVQGKHVQTFINGKKIADWTQPDDWAGPKGNPGRVIGAGDTFAFQAHDPGSTTMYKDIRVKILKP